MHDMKKANYKNYIITKRTLYKFHLYDAYGVKRHNLEKRRKRRESISPLSYVQRI